MLNSVLRDKQIATDLLRFFSSATYIHVSTDLMYLYYIYKYMYVLNLRPVVRLNV